MGVGSLKSNLTKARKRVKATEELIGGGGSSLVRAKDGSAFTSWYPTTFPSPSAFSRSGFFNSLIFYILCSVFEISTCLSVSLYMEGDFICEMLIGWWWWVCSEAQVFDLCRSV